MVGANFPPKQRMSRWAPYGAGCRHCAVDSFNMSTPAPVPARKRSPLRRFVWIAAISIAAGAVVYGSITAIHLVRGALRMEKHVRETAPLEPAARAAWQAEFGDPKALLTAFPKVDDDARATELSRLAKGLGIEFARKTSLPSDGITSEVTRRNEEPFARSPTTTTPSCRRAEARSRRLLRSSRTSFERRRARSRTS